MNKKELKFYFIVSIISLIGITIFLVLSIIRYNPKNIGSFLGSIIVYGIMIIISIKLIFRYMWF